MQDSDEMLRYEDEDSERHEEYVAKLYELGNQWYGGRLTRQEMGRRLRELAQEYGE